MGGAGRAKKPRRRGGDTDDVARAGARPRGTRKGNGAGGPRMEVRERGG